MPAPSELRGDRIYYGNQDFSSADSMPMPPGVVGDTEVSSTSTRAIGAGKVIHRENVGVELFGPAVTVAAKTQVIKIARRGGTVIGLEAVVQTAPAGGTEEVQIDLQKSTAGGAYATVLTATLDISSTATALVVVSGSIDAAKEDYIDGDHFRLVTTISGTGGAHAVGLFVAAFFDEHPVT